ncbi:MAG: hypothetical protein Q9200_003453 [Gallowayella weberi]
MSKLKRKRGIQLEELKRLFEDDPKDYKTAWEEVRDRVAELKPGAPAPAALAPSSLDLPDAEAIFSLKEVEDVLWGEETLSTHIPTHLTDNIKRIIKITTGASRSNEAFSRTIIDQIVISALFEENEATEATRTESEGFSESDTAHLELQHEVHVSKKVTHHREPRMLTGLCDYAIFYESRSKSALATNVLIIEAKKPRTTDTCLGQLVAYMGVVHTSRKEEARANRTVFGVASDGLSFRFVRIDNESRLSQSTMLEWRHHSAQIYSIFRKLIRLAALQSPSSLPIKNRKQREKVVASFGSPERAKTFDYNLRALSLREEDDDFEIVPLPKKEKPLRES